MNALRQSPFVGVVTFNPMATLRFEVLEQTVHSIEKAFPASELFLIDNCSTDGSWDAVCEVLGDKGIFCRECNTNQRGRWHAARGGDFPPDNFTPGAGRFRLRGHMNDHVFSKSVVEQSPFWVWSDDDMLWKPGAEAKLRHFWAEAPSDIDIVSGLLERVWHWNTPRETVDAGGVRVLVRDSAPGAAWTFRTPRVLDLPTTSALWRFGYDYESCKMVIARGAKVAQIDLAEHLGWECSTHGNEANQSGRPLDRERWGV